MKKLLVLPLLLGFTSTVNAETWYLLVSNNNTSHTVKMASKEDCDFWADKWVSGDTEYWVGTATKRPAGFCVKGK